MHYLLWAIFENIVFKWSVLCWSSVFYALTLSMIGKRGRTPSLCMDVCVRTCVTKSVRLQPHPWLDNFRSWLVLKFNSSTFIRWIYNIDQLSRVHLSCLLVCAVSYRPTCPGGRPWCQVCRKTGLLVRPRTLLLIDWGVNQSIGCAYIKGSHIICAGKWTVRVIIKSIESLTGKRQWLHQTILACIPSPRIHVCMHLTIISVISGLHLAYHRQPGDRRVIVLKHETSTTYQIHIYESIDWWRFLKIVSEEETLKKFGENRFSGGAPTWWWNMGLREIYGSRAFYYYYYYYYCFYIPWHAYSLYPWIDFNAH